MNLKEEERILVDRYLANELSGVELQAFLDRLENDEDFRKEVVIQNLVVDAIKEYDDKRILSRLEEAIDYRKSFLPFGLKMILFFLFITVAGIILWDYIGQSPTRNTNHLFTFNFFKKSSKDKKQTVTESAATQSKPAVKEEAVPPTETDSSVTDNIVGQETTSSEDSSFIKNAEEVVVKKDQLLISYSIKALPLDEKKAEDKTSMAQSAADKMNPAAGLPDNEKGTDSYTVEFWISPVNYHGYKLMNDRLVLFGIDEPDAMRLFVYNKNLLMKYGKDYFRLQPTGEFISLNQVKETSLPSALK